MLRRYIGAIWALTSLAAAAALAQEFRAGLSGLVKDQQGAVMAGVAIEARRLATNQVDRTTTNSSGYYALPVLTTGVYTVTATAPGFKKAVTSNLELRVGDRVQADFDMELGAVAEQVTVTGEVALLQTATASRGQVVDAAKVADMPTMARNPFLLGVIATGVAYSPGLLSRAARPFDAGGSNATEGMSVNGGRTGASDVLLDGVPNTSTETTGPTNIGFVPSPDATEEFKIATNNYDAQYGRTAGGVFSVSLKSGTNKLRGSVYHYFRNDALNANQFELNRTGAKKTAFRWNQPGLQIDGPVHIPKLYDGRNKTFFMYSWEAIRSSIPFPQTLSLPHPDALKGDFRTTLQANGQPVAIYDPLTTAETAPGAGTYTRQPFAGNVIPANRFDPVGVKLAAYIPAPTLPGIAQNFIASPNPRVDQYDAHIARIDQVLSERHRFFSRYVRGNRHEINGDGGYKGPASVWYRHQRLNQGGNFNLTSMLSPSTVLTSAVGYTRHKFDIVLYSSGFDPTTLGFPASLKAQMPQPDFFPAISITDYSAFGAGRQGGDQITFSDIWSLSETVNKTVGSHSIKFGGEFRVNTNNQNTPTSNFGSFSFNRTFTQQNPTLASPASGNSIASLLLGMPSGGSVPINSVLAYGFHYYVGFLQDDWRVSKNVTLNLGMRWDTESPVTERFNQQNAGFDTTSASPLQVPGYNLKGGLLFTDGNQRLPYSRDLNNFQPRIGLAWKLLPKTVLRTGYGVSYLATFVSAGNQGFQTSTPYVATDGAVFASKNRLSNPYPEGIRPPAGRSLGLGTFLGQSVSFVNTGRVTPKVHQFSFGFEHELPWRTVMEISYVGSRTRELDTTVALNAVTAAQLTQFGNTLNTNVRNPFANLLPGTGLNNANVAQQQLLRPYPQFVNINKGRNAFGETWYNSLQARLEKRFSHGLHFLVSYTLSKSVEATDYLNDQDPFDRPSRVLAANDTPHRLVISGGWGIPFFNQSKGVVGVLLKGWQMNAIAQFSSGQPLGAPGGFYSSGIDPALPVDQRTKLRYFNTCAILTTGVRQNCAGADEPAAWYQQPNFTLRTLSTRLASIRPPRVPNQDVSLFKTFYPNERIRAQFRAEVFNLSNSPQLGNPNTGLAGNTAGQVGLTQGNDPRSIQVALKIMF